MKTVEILKEMAFTATETQRRALEKAISAISDYDKMQEISLDLAFENDELINKSKWIPVSERLPEDKQSVLVWCPQYKNIYCAYLEKEQWWIFGAFCQIVPNEIVAWMPLPEPYKADMRGEA